MSNKSVIAELGRRLKRERLNRNISQESLCAKAGVSLKTLHNLESGRSCSMLTFIRILRSLDRLDTLDAFLPDPGLSPIQLARLQGDERQRASTPRKKKAGQ